ncbi:phage tail protein [Nocardia transvalensis]|uniref:phage tail protein n=1 Tax=Nocardia transvalensis TaxID=37333 RepID=UPI0018933E83|nr:phage tail protein [Nocardia transvalensis]MBF6332370.1 phage tail protein [Nocardia transvalensis]
MATAAVIELHGVDGSHWVLSGPGQGAQGVELGTSPTGLYDAPVKTLWVSSAFQPGATFTGVNWLKRDVVFAVNIYETASAGWEDVDSAWRKAWAYDRDATLTVTTSHGARKLRLRMSGQPDIKPKIDPHIKRFSQVTMTCTAGTPWWVEDDVTATAATTTDTTAQGASQTLWLPVSNPTDQPMYLQWVCTAPGVWTLPDFSWRDDDHRDRVITMPTLTAGQDITVDTDPMEELVVAADGSSAWARMNGKMFLHPVPAYTAQTQLPVTVSGAPTGAAVQVRCRRCWSRPWGLQ